MLWIPRSFQLKGSAEKAWEVLRERLLLGEDLLTFEFGTMSVSLGSYRRQVERWRSDTRAIIASLLTETTESSVPAPAAPTDAAAGPVNAEGEFELIKDELSDDVNSLSALVYKIQIENGLDAASLSSTSARATSAGSGDLPGYQDLPYLPGATAEDAPPDIDPNSPPDDPASDGAVFPALPEALTSDLDDGDAVSVEHESVSYAPESTASFPVYDADAVAQRDLIGIDKFVNAFSYLISARTMQPPLAIGLFGNWGSGKTFLMRAIQRRVDQITYGARISDRDQSDIGVYKRVVQVEFNAWHYVEGNLWASLVDHIFSNLRTSSAEKGTDLNQRRKVISDQLASTRDEQSALREQIKLLDKERESKQKDVTALQAQQRDRFQRAETLRARDVAVGLALGSQDAQAVDGALARVGIKLDQNAAGDAEHGLNDAREVVLAAPSIVAPFRQYGWRWAAVLVVVLLTAPAASWLMQLLKQSVSTQVFTSIAAFASSAAFLASHGARWSARALQQIEAAKARVRKRIAEASASQAGVIAALQHDLDVVEGKLAEALKARDAAASEMEVLTEKLENLTPGKLLAEFLEKRGASGDYRKHLGLTALIRRDFEELSRLVALNNDALLKSAHAPAKGAADFNRVVLYVDDLDRCPPQRVVEVLQAVHLLLSFPVFVVVLAVDPRWLAQSLASQYRDLLSAPAAANGHQATPDDYLEKIFQIPFSVAPLDVSARGRLVAGLLDHEMAPQPAVTRSGGNATPLPAAALVEAVPAAGHTDTQQPDAGREVVAGDSEGPQLLRQRDDLIASAAEFALEPLPTSIDAVDLNPSSLRFTSQEAAFLEDLLPLLETSPRSIKRYINIYRLIKSVAGITGADPTGSQPGEYQCAMLLLAFQAGLRSAGLAIVRSLAEAPSSLPGGPPVLMDTVEQVERELKVPSTGGESVVVDDIQRLRDWLQLHPGTEQWPARMLAPHAQHVSVYAFGY